MKRLGIEVWQASPLYMGLPGSNYSQFQHDTPPRLPLDALPPPKMLKALGDEVGMPLPRLAIRNLMSVRGQIVIGASNRAELSDCPHCWAEGPLNVDLFYRVSNIAAGIYIRSQRN